jgi:hypothetical protein
MVADHSGLPLDDDLDAPWFIIGPEGDIFDEKPHQLFTLAVLGGRFVPEAGNVLSQIKDSLPGHGWAILLKASRSTLA